MTVIRKKNIISLTVKAEILRERLRTHKLQAFLNEQAERSGVNIRVTSHEALISTVKYREQTLRLHTYKTQPRTRMGLNTRELWKKDVL